MAAAGLDESRLRRAFLDEAEEISQKLGESLQALGDDRANQPLVNEVFRFTHSLKSEAALMGFAVLSGLAHRMEDVLGLARDGSLALSTPVIESLLAGADMIADMMAAIARGGSDGDFDTTAAREALSAAAGLGTAGAVRAAAGAAGAAAGNAAGSTPAPAFATGSSAFSLGAAARLQVAEARDRGEGLFLVKVSVDESEGMKFPRAYLVFANLETSANVIAVDPPMEGDPADDLFYGNTTFLLTTSAGEEALRAAAAVDQVSVVGLERLDYAAFMARLSEGGRAGAAAAAGAATEPTASTGDTPQASAPAGAEEAGRRAGPAERTSIRVDTRKLDDLWSLIAELVLHKSQIARLSDDLGKGTDAATVREGLSEAFDSLDKISGGMQQAMMSTRMIPISVIFSKLPRLVRDLSRKLGKSVELVLEGEETEIDRGVVEALSDPLTHVIRNALDHGLEFPEERVRRGKSEKGRVTVSARRQGGMIVIDLADDGRGMDVAGIRRKALAMDVKNAATLTEAQLLDLVFLPGFSTKDVVTDLSGRGVGMDVVATRVRGDLKGDVVLTTEPGRGTRVSLLLPLTLTIVNALLVRGDTHLYAIPLTDIDSTVKILATEIREEEGRDTAPWDGEEIAVHSLGGLLGNGRRREEEYTAAVLRNAEHRAFLVVDELIEEREIVIRPVDDLLNAHRLFAGVSFLEDGRLVFILDTSFIRRDNFREGDAWAPRF